MQHTHAAGSMDSHGESPAHEKTQNFTGVCDIMRLLAITYSTLRGVSENTGNQFEDQDLDANELDTERCGAATGAAILKLSDQQLAAVLQS